MNKPSLIPDIPENLQDAVSALARAADIFRRIMVLAAEGRPMSELLTKYENVLLMSDRVCETWIEKLSLNENDGGPPSLLN